MRYIPLLYQVDCKKFLLNAPRSALFLDMGLGKTAITLDYIHDMVLDSCKVQRVLVVAPLRVATITWPDEINKWSHSRQLSYHVLHGKGRIATAPDTNITLTNYETLPWLIKHPHLFSRYEMVIFDESTLLKNAGSNRWKQAFAMFGALDYITLLTGTPQPNGLQDIWAQMYLLDHGSRLGRTKTTFETQYFRAGGYGNYKLFPLKGSTEQVIEKIEDLARTLKTSDYIQLPKLNHNKIVVDLPTDARKGYDKLEKDFFVDLGSDTVIAFNAASLSAKLRQYTQGFLYREDGTAIRVHTAKADAIEELLATHPNENFLVAVNFVDEIEYLTNRFKGAESIYGKTNATQSANTISKWNSGKLRLLFAHPASIGHGLNLQSGGRMVVWTSAPWNLEHWLQFNKRLHRRGQAKPVFIHTIIARNTIDELVFGVLRGKDSAQNKLIEGLIEYRNKRTRHGTI